MAKTQEKAERRFYLKTGDRITELSRLRIDEDRYTAHAPELPAPIPLEDIAPRRMATAKMPRDRKTMLLMKTTGPEEGGLYEFEIDRSVPEITTEDRTIMKTTLEEYRIGAALNQDVIGYGFRIATMTYLMKQMGIGGGNARISDKDAKNMDSDLRTMTELGDATNAGFLRVMRSRLGLGADLSEGANPLYIQLSKDRKIKNGGGIAMSHYIMRRLQIKSVVTPEDRSLMEKELEAQRAAEKKDGMKIGILLLCMEGIGIRNKATDEDRRVIRDELEKFRTNENGMGVAWTHYLLRELHKKD